MKKPEKEDVVAVIWFAIGVMIWGFGIYFGESGYISSSLVIKIALLYFLVSFYAMTWYIIKEKGFWFCKKEEHPFKYKFTLWTYFFIDTLLSIAIIYY